jgi:hypothetical protein
VVEIRLTRESKTKIIIESDKPIYTFGDMQTLAVSEQPMKTLQVTYKDLHVKKKKEGDK